MFKEGQSLWTIRGQELEFDHEHDGWFYCHPVIVREIQATSYSGEDFHIDEETTTSDHLLRFSRDDLSENPPTEKMDKEIQEKRQEIRDLRIKQKESIKKHQDEIRKIDNDLDVAKSRLEKYMEKYSDILTACRLLDGEVLYPLQYDPQRKGRVNGQPEAISLNDISYLQLKKQRRAEGWLTSARKRNGWDREVCVTFFNTEKERQDYISNEFKSVCNRFIESPDYGNDNRYSDHGRIPVMSLHQWVNDFPFLSMPDEIVNGIKLYEEAEKQKKKQALQKQIDEI